jgi:hypothetical protein
MKRGAMRIQKKANKKEETHEVDVMRVEQGRVNFYVVGTEGLFLNRLSEKTKRQLLAPPRRLNQTEKDTTFKHEPVNEFRDSAHKLNEGPTLLALPSSAFKKAMSSAALDLPDVHKAQIGRLVWVEGEFTHVYGLPKMRMDPVRPPMQAPDIRTRCFLARWCAKLSVTFVMPVINEQSVVNLLAAAGIFIGVGDWRPEKGSGHFGAFRLAAANDKEFLSIVREGGRKQQESAMQAAEPFNAETSELLAWWSSEAKKRTQAAKGKAAKTETRVLGKPNLKPPEEQ